MADTSAAQPVWMIRAQAVLGFLIGLFGAAAILGVYFKIAQLPNWETFMQIGFIGEAAAFIVMGLFSLLAGFVGRPAAPAAEDVEYAAEEHSTAITLRSMMDEEVGDELNQLLKQLAGEASYLGNEIQEIAEDMRKTRSAVQAFHTEVHRVVSDGLGDNAAMLSESLAAFNGDVQAVGTEMQHVRETVVHMRTHFDQIGLDELTDGSRNVGEGMRSFGTELNEMSNEMQHARSAVEKMRSELEHVVEGDLAGDAQRLGQGMQTLGSEMQGAGGAVEKMRGDLEVMLARFRQFNDPAAVTRQNGA